MAEAIYPDLRGKVAVVTGGASGIGEAVVRVLAAQGARVGFIDRGESAARRLEADLGGAARAAAADLTDIAALRAAFAHLRAALGPVSVLVNNAARDDRHRIEDVTPEYWDERLATNLRHAFFAAQATLDDLRAAGPDGAVVTWARSPGAWRPAACRPTSRRRRGWKG